MKFKIKYLAVLIIVFVSASNLFATKRYWVSSVASNWNNTANWSATSGGAGGVSTPSSTDTVYFDSLGIGNCSLDVAITIKRFEMTASYPGTFYQGSNSITATANALALYGGTFSGGTADISAGGFILSGCSFTSTSSTLIITGNYSFSSGSFTANGGLVKFRPSGARTFTGSTTFSDVEIDATANASTIGFGTGTVFTVSDLTISGTYQTTLSSTTSFDVKGDITLTNTYSTTSTGQLTITGTGDQHIYGFTSGSGFALPDVTINKNSGTLYLHNYIPINGGLSHTNGTVDAGTSTVGFVWTQTISGTFSLNNMAFSGSLNFIYTLTNANITANGNVSISYGAGYARLEGGNIHVKGNVSVNNTTNTNHPVGTATNLILDGTGDQNITGSQTIGAGYFPGFTINKASGTLNLLNNISVAGSWIYQAGTINLGTSTVVFGGSNQSVSGSHTLHKVVFSSGTQTIAAGTNLTVDELLTVDGGIVNTGTVTVTGNISIANTAVGGGGSATFLLNGTNNQSITGNTTGGWCRMPKVTIDKPSGILTVTNTVSIFNSFTYLAGVVDYSTSSIVICGTGTISGSQAFHNLKFVPSETATITIQAGTVLTCNGVLTFGGTKSIILNTGTIEAKGDISVTNTNTSTGSGGSATIVINGTGGQTLTGSGTAGAGYLPKIQIDKPSGTLTLSSVISCSRDWVYVQGDVESVSGSSQVVFIGNYNLDGEGTTGTMQFNKLVIGANTRTLTGNLNLRSTLNLQAGTTLAAGTYNINIGGDWKQANSTSNFTSAGGTVTFDGSNYVEIIRNSGASTAVFPKLAVNKSGGSIKLNSPVQVTNNLTLTQGIIKAIVDVTSSNYLELTDNATCTGGSDNAFVHGTIRKTGDDSIVFPLGDTTLPTGSFHPLGISAPSSATDQFEASYYGVGQTLGDSLVDSLDILSDCEYWKLNRLSGSSNVKITLSWNENSCNTNAHDIDMRIAAWDGAKWTDQGATGFTSSGNKGSITSLGIISLPFPIYEGLAIKKKNITYAELKKKRDAGYFNVMNNKVYFKYDGEYRSGTNLNYKVLSNNGANTGNAVAGHILKNSATGTNAWVYGDNRFVLDVAALPVGFYTLEVKNEKDEKFYLRFKK